MRHPIPVLIVGFLAGVLCLGVFLTATGRISSNRATLESGVNLPPLGQGVTQVPQGNAPANSNPDLPDPSSFGPPNSDAQLPPLTQGDPARPPRVPVAAGGPALPDPSTFAPDPVKTSLASRQAPPQVSLPPVTDADIRAIESKNLILPIAGLTAPQIQDTFNDTRGSGRKHEAADILSPRGTPVLAMTEGNVAKLFLSQRGGLTVYQFDNQGVYCYYYAHLDHYAEGLKEGMLLRKGNKVGYVGSTGDADAKVPHLHLAIFKLGREKHYWQGTAINPYPILMHILGK
ncbi:MAG: peptidoglycan DD-metalloendopeptidase family protein [Acidobacteriota bacterium]|nr:peptidoglycan DD-metalloendopeptidase family protein [Acidobacteriota bacterium]